MNCTGVSVQGGEEVSMEGKMNSKKKKSNYSQEFGFPKRWNSHQFMMIRELGNLMLVVVGD